MPDLSRRRFHHHALATLAATGLPGLARAEGAPLTLMVPYPAGALSDAIARVVSEPLRGVLGGPTVIVDNLGGVSGTLAAAKVLAAPPDGQMLFQGSPNELILPPLALRQVKLRAEDFRLVHPIGESPLVLIARAGLPVKSADDLIALARASTDKPLSYGTTGIGSAYHLVTEHLAKTQGVRFNHVPYRGGAPMIQDLLGGRLDFVITVYNSVLVGMAEKGQVIPLAVLGREPIAQMPRLPTAEGSKVLAGLPASLWTAYFVPLRTPEPVVQKLHLALLKVASDGTVRATLEKLGMRPALPTSLADSARFYASETTRYRQLAQAMALQPE